MKRPTLHVLLLFAIFACGCRSEADTSAATSTAVERTPTQSKSLDFDALLTAVDNAIGKRFQSMQMDGMNSVSYQYDGPMKPAVDIVDPIAKSAGFATADNTPTLGTGEMEKEMQAKMGFNMSSVGQTMYTHPNGDTLIIARMDMSNADMDMKLLTIQLMNPQKMSEFGAKVHRP